MIDFPEVSPLRQEVTGPAPRHPDQITMFESPVDTVFSAGDQPMAVAITIRLHRTLRQKCSNCGRRRICFYVGLGDAIKSPAMCAKCAGIR